MNSPPRTHFILSNSEVEVLILQLQLDFCEALRASLVDFLLLERPFSLPQANFLMGSFELASQALESIQASLQSGFPNSMND